MSDGRRRSAALPGLDILLGVEDEGWLRVLPQEPEVLVRGAVEATAGRVGLSSALRSELGVTLTTNEAVGELNARWRGKDRPTNILSFPTRPIVVGEMPGPLMGDLVLARETCVREAQEEGKTVGDHFVHLVVHGFLHLLGYDHLDDRDAERMEAMEVSILSDLSIEDPYGSAGDGPAARSSGR